MIKSSQEPSPFTGLYGNIHICDRCHNTISFGDSKKPLKNKVEICQQCAIDMWENEKKIVKEGKY